ncbi:glycosyl hydrolases family 31-domain-containing protein [Aspergillus karnatakaensis]|uniref:glycosyl hydrolases family 31-domain-containing protein n=1 Tax=Aspergillus karnatakaensis TaxID=1810916 RepID=UPI003CCD6305
MVKFSHGCWHPAPDTLIDWAVETVVAETRGDALHFVTSSKPINHRGDTLNNPTLTHSLTSPIDNVIHLSSTHWTRQKSVTQGPHFELYPAGQPERQSAIQTTKTAEGLKLEEGSLTASVDTRPKSFDISFAANGKLLTKLGWRSVGYVKQGTTALHPRANYLDPNKGKRWVTYQLQLGVGDKVYGLGERFGPFAKNGQSVEIWNEDGGTGSELTYKNIPFFVTSAGYGVFIPTSNYISFEIQSERTTRVNISVPGETLAMYLIYGPDPKSIIERYTTITGKPALPPAWTFGLWLSTSFTTEYDEGTVTSFLDGMSERDIPVSVFHFDCFWMPGFKWCDYEFDKDYFPDAKGQLQRIKERGIHICVWINSYIAQESSIFDEAAEKGYLLKRTDGSVWQYDFWQAGMGFVDFTNPDACKWYQDKLQALVDMGVDSFKTDFGERIPTGDVVYFDGSSPEKMHNYYSFLYNKVTFEVLEKNFGPNKAALFARSATAGCQRFPVHWGGDPYSTFEAMAETLRGGMSLALSGFGYWAHDIGGFEGKPDPALFKRWIAFGLFSSHSRLHGSGSFRVPWLIDESGEADKVLKHFVRAKHSLMPYLYASAIETHKTGVPMLRSLFLEYPKDPIAWHQDMQYFLGDSLLVAPVFNDHGEIQYYLPQGEWYGILDGKLRSGGGYVTEQHDFFSLPVLLRPGAAVFVSESGELDSVVYDWSRDVVLLVNWVEGMDKTVRIADYEKAGEFKLAVTVRDTKDGLTVNVAEGKIAGSFGIKVVNKSIESGDGEVTEGNTLRLKEGVSQATIQLK